VAFIREDQQEPVLIVMNPTSERVTLEFDAGAAGVRDFNYLRSLITSEKINILEGKFNITLNQWSGNIYSSTLENTAEDRS
jgi:hypothetical protein